MAEQRRWIFGAVLSAALLIPGSAVAQEKAQNHQSAAAPAAADPAKPGAEQASLATLAGDYNRVIKFVAQMGATAAPSSGTAKISVQLGGRFLLEESTDTVFGRTVEGLRVYGYDNATKQYEMARMYTMSTAITMMKGTSIDGGKTIDFIGESESSGGGKTPLHVRLRRVSDDEFVETFFTAGPDGKEAAFQETTYTRKK